MSITDELREYVSSMCGWLHGAKCSGYNKLLAIADRIDEQAERESEAAWQRGYERGEDEAKFEQLDELRKEVQADWVKLPADADGITIRIGERLDCGDGEEITALWMEYLGSNDWAVHGGVGNGAYYEPYELYHVAADSFDRIIEDACDMASRCCDDDAGKAELVERCRRLAGEAGC